MIECSFCGQAHKGDRPFGRCAKCYADLSDEPDLDGDHDE